MSHHPHSPEPAPSSSALRCSSPEPAASGSESSLSSVHTTSTTAQMPHSTFRGCCLTGSRKLEFMAVREMYESFYAMKKIERMDGCRSAGWFHRQISTGKIAVHARSCHVKFCPLCSSPRANTIRTNTERWITTADHPKMLTLTIKHSIFDSLADNLQMLYLGFRKLRRLQLWNRVKGGIWFFEIKRTKDGWHPHLHVLLEGGFLPQHAIREDWHRITGDSFIVDIRPIANGKKAAEYVSKYATKPCQFRNLKLELRQELYIALLDRRCVGTFGTAKKAHLTKREIFNKEDWKPIGSWSVVVNMFHYSPLARAIVEAWQQQKPLPEFYDLSEFDDFIDHEPPDHEQNPYKSDKYRSLQHDAWLF